MKFANRAANWLFSRLPAYNVPLMRFSARYLDRFNGDNIFDPAANGEYRFLRSLLGAGEAGRVVFDVGANVGEWSAMALGIDPTLRLHCFEPSAPTFAKLQAHGLGPGAVLNRFGLGQADEVLTLNVVPGQPGLNSIFQRQGMAADSRSTQAERIEVRNGDAYCEANGIDRIALLKVDVEGYEMNVLKGLERILARRGVEAIQFEYGGCNIDARVTLGDMFEFLSTRGYDLFKLFPEGPRLVPCYSQTLETFKHSNWVARLKAS